MQWVLILVAITQSVLIFLSYIRVSKVLKLSNRKKSSYWFPNTQNFAISLFCIHVVILLLSIFGIYSQGIFDVAAIVTQSIGAVAYLLLATAQVLLVAFEIHGVGLTQANQH